MSSHASPTLTAATWAAVTRSVCAGAATGGRTFTGLAALTASTPHPATAQPDRTLALPAVQTGLGLAAAVELVLDKLPNAPSRLNASGLAPRLVVAAVCGLVVARRHVPLARHAVAGDHTTATDGTASAAAPAARQLVCVTAAVAAAGSSAWVGVRWRRRSSRGRFASIVGAVVEDAAVAGLAGLAAR